MSVPIGETACLSAAFLWAVSVQLFAEPIGRHGARAVNLFKCAFATILLGLTLGITGGWAAWGEASGLSLFLVALSGIVGLTIGDTALFAAVKDIGAHRSLLLQTTAPIFAAGIALPLGERLSGGQWTGAATILIGVFIVLTGDSPRNGGLAERRIPGLLAGITAAVGQGTGVVIAKAGMATVPILHATFLRLGIGAAGLILLAVATGKFTRSVRACTNSVTFPRLATASFFGTYLAMLLMMAGVAWAPASVAAVLLATPPIFSLVVESLIEKRRPSTSGFIGTLIAVTGVALLATSG